MAEPQDMTTARDTYHSFLALFKWGAIVTALVTAIVLLIIAN